jgi:2-deoxy-D-gluconate 3-dehydrogenase
MRETAFSLQGRRALVTGADSGIGRALAIGLARQGADLVVHHLDRASGAEAVCRAVEATGRTAVAVQADFAENGGAARLAEHVLTAHGPIDILIANAAVERRKPWTDISAADVEAHIAVNFTALLQLVGRLVPEMTSRGWGRVVALGSVLAVRPRAETGVYAALKAAQLTAIRAIAREVAGRGVTMNVVSPGAIETERTGARYADPAFRQAVVAKIPSGRPGLPEDVVAPVLMLCSEEAAYITGANIPVDGGWSIGDAPGGTAEAAG